jgi:hypothetical protein
VRGIVTDAAAYSTTPQVKRGEDGPEMDAAQSFRSASLPTVANVTQFLAAEILP